jgi:hypothetical protein
MPDDKTNRGPQDASRINGQEDYELRYWTKRFGVSAERLREVVQRVGASAAAVEAELKKSAWRGKRQESGLFRSGADERT